MRDHFNKLLQSFEFEGWTGLFSSLFPSTKYSMITPLALCFSSFAAGVQCLFGLDVVGFIALLVALVTELTAGVLASLYKRDTFSSNKLSRFTIKAALYLVLIYISYSMASSFKSIDNELASSVFRWIHVFLVVQIVIENMVSILESIAVITGKSKEHWIRKMQDKVSDFLFK